MNYAIVLRLLSYILLTEGALLLLPAAASLCYGEWFVMGVFLLTAALSAALGALLQNGGIGLILYLFPTLSDQLVYCGHESSP